MGTVHDAALHSAVPAGSVVEGLSRPDEDTRGGFTYGGWRESYNDEVMGREMAKAVASRVPETLVDFPSVFAHNCRCIARH